ncbi:DUF721 domain-containing protein [Streptomyces griseus]|uniref:hypothetical protein n=1 Tax=Streptomyces griseus TaxID=1911 RepID=UPI0036C1655E
MTGEQSGVDLARQALIAAREAAKKNGATQTKKPKQRTTVVRGDGREPLGLGAAIGMMMTERGMTAPVAGGNVLADFDAILTAAAPELAGRVQAVALDAETGRLDQTAAHPPRDPGRRRTATRRTPHPSSRPTAAPGQQHIPGAALQRLLDLPPAHRPRRQAAAILGCSWNLDLRTSYSGSTRVHVRDRVVISDRFGTGSTHTTRRPHRSQMPEFTGNTTSSALPV